VREKHAGATDSVAPDLVEIDAPDAGRVASPDDIPRIGTRVEEGIAAVAMALICLITFANVLVRYLTNASFAFTEEFSIFLLVVMTFAGASAAFAHNRHIRMEYFVRKLPPVPWRWVERLVTLCGLMLFGILAFYGTRLFYDDWKYGTTSPGIGIPQWIYSVWLPILSALIALRIVGRLSRLFRSA
jgi:TRAP-type C4-dicarboxylate transport system permease small subunit